MDEYLKSPLERAQNLNLKPVPQSTVDALEKRLITNYLPKINDQVRENRLSAEKLRSKVLY